MNKLFSRLLVTIVNIASGLDGYETAKIKEHKLRFWIPGWRLYKVVSSVSSIEFYIITNQKLPKYKYKTFMISGGMKRLNDALFLWRKKSV
jgi:hypothetical protein